MEKVPFLKSPQIYVVYALNVISLLVLTEIMLYTNLQQLLLPFHKDNSMETTVPLLCLPQDTTQLKYVSNRFH